MVLFLLKNFFFLSLLTIILSGCNSGPIDKTETTPANVGTSPTVTNNSPDISDISDLFTLEDQSTQTINFIIQDIDSTPSCSSVTFTMGPNNQNILSNSGIYISGVAPYCRFILTPNANKTGVVTLNFSISDGSLVDSDSFTLTVIPVNDAPTISSLPSITMWEDTPITSYFTIDDIDSPVDCTTSVFKSSSNPSVVNSNQVTFSGTQPNCAMTFVPVANASGSTAITLTVADGTTAYQSASVTFTLNVLPVNDPPTINMISDQSTFINTSTNPVTFTIFDIDSNLNCSSSVSKISSNTSVLNASGIVIGGTAPSCTVSLNPVANSVGVATTTLSVSDGFFTASQSFNLTVSLLNYSRLAGSQNATTMGRDVFVDSNFNSYVTGYTDGSLDGQTLSGLRDAFVIKYSSSGVKQWTRLSGMASAYTYAESLAVDSSGNIYISGRTTGNLDGQSMSGVTDAFLMKYDKNGNKLWTRLSGVSTASTIAQDLALDSSGNIFLTGSTNQSLDAQTKTGIKDAFVIKYNNSGTKIWTKLLGVLNKETTANSISLDSAGNILIMGNTNGDLDGQTKNGSWDSFVTKYNNSGVKQWTRLLGGLGFQTSGFEMAVDSSQNIYITGATLGSLDDQMISGTTDAFLCKFNMSGDKMWTRLFGVSLSDTLGRGISVDSAANIYVTGETSGDLDNQSKTGTKDAFLVKYDVSGNKQWTKLSGVINVETIGHSVALDPLKNPYVTGISYGNFNGQNLTGIYDAFFTTKFAFE